MSRRLPEDSGRVVLGIFRSNSIRAYQPMRFASIRAAFLRSDRGLADLSDGICFLINHGCLRRGAGAQDADAYYLTELGTALIVGRGETGPDRNWNLAPVQRPLLGSYFLQASTQSD